jgi:hypothetical protein
MELKRWMETLLALWMEEVWFHPIAGREGVSVDACTKIDPIADNVFLESVKRVEPVRPRESRLEESDPQR